MKFTSIIKNIIMFCLSIITLNSCSKKDSTPAPQPTSSFTWQSTNTTAPSTVVFTNTSTNATSYSWDFGDGNSSIVASPTHIYALAGTYTAKLVATGSGGTASMSEVITIKTPIPSPVASFTWRTSNTNAPSTVVFTNTSTNATSYSWDFGDGNSSTIASPTHIYNTVGTFTATLIASSSVGSATSATQIITTSIYTIGQSYGGGKIFYIDSTGLHGLISATTDQSTSIAWYNGTFLTSSSLSTAIGSGKQNTLIIIGLQGSGNYAASLCKNLVLNGYNDWYLPSKDELNQLYIQSSIIGGFTSTFYWSSSDWGDPHTSSAWAQNFADGTQNGHDKARNNCQVRAIRSF